MVTASSKCSFSAWNQAFLRRVAPLSVMALAFVWIGAAPARADTVVQYTLDGVTFADGGTATGTFSLDYSDYSVFGSNILVTDPSNPGSPEIFSDATESSQFVFPSVGGEYGVAFFNPDSPSYDDLQLALVNPGIVGPVAVLPVDTTGGGSEFNYDADGSPQSVAVTAGQLDPAPEPASFALLGLGLTAFTVIRLRKAR